MNTETEYYKKYSVEINSVPENQFDFDDFGWAFQVFQEGELYFQLIIKTTRSNSSHDTKSKVLKWGKAKVYQLIDEQSLKEGNFYCYLWDKAQNTLDPQQVECEGFALLG